MSWGYNLKKAETGYAIFFIARNYHGDEVWLEPYAESSNHGSDLLLFKTKKEAEEYVEKEIDHIFVNICGYEIRKITRLVNKKESE